MADAWRQRARLSINQTCRKQFIQIFSFLKFSGSTYRPLNNIKFCKMPRQYNGKNKEEDISLGRINVTWKERQTEKFL